MSNAFDTYLKQLSELEQSENRTALQSLCISEEPILSNFKSIWGALQILLQSTNIDAKIVEDIKSAVPIMYDVKASVDLLLQTPSKAHAEEIKCLQKEIDRLTLVGLNRFSKKIEDLSLKNKAALEAEECQRRREDDIRKLNDETRRKQQQKKKEEEEEERLRQAEDEKRNRIFAGQIVSANDLAYAELHVCEGTQYPFFKSLIRKTSNPEVLNNIYVVAQNNLKNHQLHYVMWELMVSKISFSKKEDAVIYLICRAKTVDSLTSIGYYCKTEKLKIMYENKRKALRSETGCLGCFSSILIFALLASVAIFAFIYV